MKDLKFGIFIALASAASIGVVVGLVYLVVYAAKCAWSGC